MHRHPSKNTKAIRAAHGTYPSPGISFLWLQSTHWLDVRSVDALRSFLNSGDLKWRAKSYVDCSVKWQEGGQQQARISTSLRRYGVPYRKLIPSGVEGDTQYTYGIVRRPIVLDAATLTLPFLVS